MKPIWNPGKTAITINKKELIDLVSCIDYLPSAGFLPVYPIYFAASTDDKVIEGMAGLDKEENQVLYVKGKLVNKQDPDEMKYEQISKMMTDYFNLNDMIIPLYIYWKVVLRVSSFAPIIVFRLRMFLGTPSLQKKIDYFFILNF